MIQSLTQCSEKQTKADQDKLFYFGDLTLRHSINNPLELSLADKAIYKEFEELVQSEFFLKSRCEEIGLSDFIRFSYPNNWKDYKQIYANNNYYKCLIKFIGALYLEFGFKVTHQFIHRVILGLPNKKPASILLEIPESIMIQKFSLYKIESPVIKTTPNTLDFPFFTTTIESGSSEVSKAYGLTKNESYNLALKYLNDQSNSLSSLMAHILKNTKSYNFIKKDKNNFRKDRNNLK
ncbi:hypothetical protein DICPUDRAFT_93274 [Dictyostelium purpureum]|uniref:RNase III domain-containing protein n=1 Tax=Dictyostelium purpureum TaxID=5786 RepID=F1A4Y0_DICPU|nr:uncharacterized protein DICPUDRAFT_93274 [Dictyostelium purpureum]EGC28750.1 hypothetical protein DICPUDRAFT_93274 [Dictyostelium purpureum]|eukprot:XP_003294729.1 hypothetical protein DICPUDRAFT_93274 [Dictyostelium purpureum]